MTAVLEFTPSDIFNSSVLVALGIIAIAGAFEILRRRTIPALWKAVKGMRTFSQRIGDRIADRMFHERIDERITVGLLGDGGVVDELERRIGDAVKVELTEIQRELRTNGGSSLKDITLQNRDAISALQRAQDQTTDEVTGLRKLVIDLSSEVRSQRPG